MNVSTFWTELVESASSGARCYCVSVDARAALACSKAPLQPEQNFSNAKDVWWSQWHQMSLASPLKIKFIPWPVVIQIHYSTALLGALTNQPCCTVINKVHIILIIFLKISEQYITGLFSSTLEPNNPWHINSQRDPEIPHFAYESLLESLLSFGTENWKIFFHIWYFLCHAVYLREIRRNTSEHKRKYVHISPLVGLNGLS